MTGQHAGSIPVERRSMQVDLLEEYSLLRIILIFLPSKRIVLKNNLYSIEMLQIQASSKCTVWSGLALMDGCPSMPLITSHHFESSGIIWRFPVSTSSPADVP